MTKGCISNVCMLPPLVWYITLSWTTSCQNGRCKGNVVLRPIGWLIRMLKQVNLPYPPVDRLTGSKP